MIGKSILHYRIIEKLGEGGIFQKHCLNRHAELGSASILFSRSQNNFGMTVGGVVV